MPPNIIEILIKVIPQFLGGLYDYADVLVKATPLWGRACFAAAVIAIPFVWWLEHNLFDREDADESDW